MEDPCRSLPRGEARHLLVPALGETKLGLHMAVGGIDEKEKGEGNFGRFHHEDWWTGHPKNRTWLNQFWTLVFVP